MSSAHQGSICSVSEKHKRFLNANIDAGCTINLLRDTSWLNWTDSVSLTICESEFCYLHSKKKKKRKEKTNQAKIIIIIKKKTDLKKKGDYGSQKCSTVSVFLWYFLCDFAPISMVISQKVIKEKEKKTDWYQKPRRASTREQNCS